MFGAHMPTPFTDQQISWYGRWIYGVLFHKKNLPESVCGRCVTFAGQKPQIWPIFEYLGARVRTLSPIAVKFGTRQWNFWCASHAKFHGDWARSRFCGAIYYEFDQTFWFYLSFMGRFGIREWIFGCCFLPNFRLIGKYCRPCGAKTANLTKF